MLTVLHATCIESMNVEKRSELTIKNRSINYEHTVKSKRLDKRNRETNLRAIFLLILKVLPISFSLSCVWLLLILLSKSKVIRELRKEDEEEWVI
jgi:hypothetical protein